MFQTFRLVITTSLFLIIFTSCETKKSVTKGESSVTIDQNQMNDLGFVAATVKDFSKEDGCGFLIVLDESEQILQTLKPIAASFQKDGLKVWLKYRPIRPISPTCKEGTPIDIEELKIA